MSTQRVFKIVVLLGLASHCMAQEIDTAILSDQAKAFTVLDEIQDVNERQAFLSIYNEQDPRERRYSAASYLAAYPSSWLLAPVYEIAAKASIVLGDYPGALQYGKESLRLLPENPLLLAPLANVEVQGASKRCSKSMFTSHSTVGNTPIQEMLASTCVTLMVYQ